MEPQNTQTQIRNPPTFQTKPSLKTHQSSDTGIGVHKSLHVFRRSWRRRREMIKDVKVSEKSGCVIGDDEEEEEDREEIERKIEALKRIVPNGESLGVDKLFDETAGYIVSLQYQVKTLKALTSFFEKLEKEKTKFGG